MDSKKMKALEKMGEIFQDIMFSHVSKHKTKKSEAVESPASESSEAPAEQAKESSEGSEPVSHEMPKWMKKQATVKK